MQRYFAEIVNNKVILSDGDIHHVLNVMRNRVGNEIEVVADKKLYVARINSVSPLEIAISYEIPADSELKQGVTIFFALAKGDKIDLVVQKATELGASKIVLITSKRCVTDFSNKDVNKKLERYNKIAKEAAEQSHRLVIPEVLGVYNINNIPNDLLCDVNFVAYEKEAGSTANSFEFDSSIKSISVLIGSEGGLEEAEVDTLIFKGFKSISLGKRILRCETAALYSLSVLSYLLEK